MNALKHVDNHMDVLITDLQKLIQQPSVSAKNEGIEECAKLVKSLLESSGLKSEILRLKKGVAPIVFAEIKSKSNPHKTLMFYNHYDVQPAEPFDLWNDPPFSGIRKGNKIFGRGSTDDKGELITRIKAVEACLATTGDVPCNIKFLIEGEEETGSTHIEEYLKKYKKKFSNDGVIWEFGYVDAKNRPIIGLGMKGLLYVELSVKESIRDAHSSLAVLIKNPAWRLIEAVNTLRNSDGKILIKDWYKEVSPLSKNDLKIIQKEPFDENVFKKEFGIKSFVGNKRGLNAKKALVGEATCNIAGFVSGYTGDGAKTVLPGSALVKIDFRLIPNMDPKKQVIRLKNHLKSKGFSEVKIKIYHGEAAARTNSSNPFVSQVKSAADQIFGNSILNVSNAGTGPMYSFVDILKSPCVSIGSTYMFSRIHSPNEFARIDLLKKTTKCICLIMENFGKN
ncbi:MAG: M20/M25/M40 family metallo-hydrolase [Candidatus Nitrosopumilus limneticus]|nr:Acetylornithine deacetylase [Candidatus Nitrosopumilus limneticus]MDC4212856.1 M20/M25/M40 family metallo-hydrolase [Candidatus Nitrosopumilus limneticus]MDC4213358.1 M20/M25/M40 family metallo-hydrolase [Candidatus Nitrosopumilus limneticus]MDC4215533.1 M20/M25/M40 family metallo-hydrolase [Candidatus Nitrosopumilus limneticus]MDC4216940.1 M20/M25/M40 family metallo-hydrolase [Candidatus Nitrosopumilus limneticus]